MHTPKQLDQHTPLLGIEIHQSLRANLIAQLQNLIEYGLPFVLQMSLARAAIGRMRPALDPVIGFHAIQNAHQTHGLYAAQLG